ncbi:PilW family protein [Undibacterium sp.]|uniref:PilW family protein n=1 Tax=Undibacterium sp. TaxID=1914977 RepID=UPI00374FF14D
MGMKSKILIRASVFSRIQRGFSLVELMIAMVIGLLMALALIALFYKINRTNTEMAKTNSQIENGRFALQILAQDVTHGGFWGSYVPEFDDLTLKGTPKDAPTAVPNPCLPYSTPWTAANIANLLGIPVQVYGETPPSGAGCVTVLSANKKAGTDVLVVRYAENCVAGSGGNCDADVAGNLYFQSSYSYRSYCASGLTADAVPYILDTTGFDTLHEKDCTTAVTAKRKFISNIYYVRDYAKTVGDGIPTLMVTQFGLTGGVLAHQKALPLIEGIEGFRVMLGIDSLSKTGAAVDYTKSIAWADPSNYTTSTNRGDGVPDGDFVSCTDTTPCTVTQLTNVTVAKLYVLARSSATTSGYTDNKTYELGGSTLGPFNDGFKRHVFSTTVRVNNVAVRRDLP